MMMLTVILFLVNFFRTLLIILIVYYGIKIIRLVVLPLLSNQPKQPNQTNPRRNKRPEGDVRVEKKQQYDSRISKDDGEYVDFEEID